MENQFVFIVEKPLRNIGDDMQGQRIHIHAKYPHYIYSIDIEPEVIMAEKSLIDLAIAQLKIKAIQEIANATFEYSKE
jgi:hypothetical protein